MLVDVIYNFSYNDGGIDYVSNVGVEWEKDFGDDSVLASHVKTLEVSKVEKETGIKLPIGGVVVRIMGRDKLQEIEYKEGRAW